MGQRIKTRSRSEMSFGSRQGEKSLQRRAQIDAFFATRLNFTGRWCSVGAVKPLRPFLLAFAAASCLVWPACPCRAAEDPSGAFTLTWNAPETCPSQQQVQAGLTNLLGGTIRIPHGDDLDVHASVEHGRVWSVALATYRAGRAGGRRFIEAPSCQALAEATALIVALMIDPDAVATHAREARGEPAPPASIDAAPVALSSETTRFLVGIHAQTRLATLPGMDIGVGLGVGIVSRRWRLELRGTYSVRRDQVAHLSTLPDANGRFNILTGALSGCFNLGQAGFAFGPCAIAEAGMVSAKGYGVDTGFTKRAPWVALGGGGYASMPLGHHLEATVHLDVLVPLWRPAYVFAGTPGAVFQAPAVGGLALASIGWRF